MRYCFICLFSLLVTAASAQNIRTGDSLVARLVLIGDAGALAPDGHHTVVEAVEKLLVLDEKTTVLYLGDNLYRYGLPDEQMNTYSTNRAVLDSQANIADHSKGMVYFIPGNHDWTNGGPLGYQTVLRQQRYLDGLGKKNLKFYPEDGCPGPVAVDIAPDVVLVMMDSQWWLHPNDKPGIESDCPFKTKEDVLAELRDITIKNNKKLLIFACHHPFKTFGSHGGYFTPKQHLFPFTDMRPNLYIPLPILGSIYPISRAVFGDIQDPKHPTYANMIAQVDEVLKSHPNVIHVAGHEHALEWITDSNNHYIVSGAGCKTNRVSKTRKAKYAGSHLGFATLDIYKDKTVRCTFFGASPDSLHALYSDVVLNYSKLPTAELLDTTTPVAAFKDTVVVPTNTRYAQASGLHRFLLGNNYRAEWAEPVNLKVFHINTEKGGLKIIGAGGGFQTKSLHLVDSKGRQWNLRTIDKDPQRVIPPQMRETFARDVVQDMISAAHPYAPLAVAPMAAAANVVQATPEFFYVPDDPAFSSFYRPLFANKVCLLEQGDPSFDESHTKSTAKLFNKLFGENDHFVDQQAVLRARLFDFLIGDWDRHFDQWRWGVSDTGVGKLYYPIARDRDQAFFNSDGLVLRLAARRRLPWMKGFHDHYRKINWLGYSARNFDRIFLNELGPKDWAEAAKYIQERETDTVITHAVQKMPPGITAIGGEKIIHTLQSRREGLPKQAMKYYRFISREVSIMGSNRDEYFKVQDVDSGIRVQVYAKDKKQDTTLLMYSRNFDPKVTREIRMFGFNGNDVFDVDPNVHTRMKLRMIGGRGNDTFNIRGRARSHIYDLTTEDNPIQAHKHTDIETGSNPLVNEFSTQIYTYDFVRLPMISLGYNAEDGFLAGPGFIHRRYGFRKDPFKTEHRLMTLYSISEGAYQLKYRGTYTGFYHNYDLVLNAELQNPTLTNFFGLGNSTERDPQRSIAFYRARYKFFTTEPMLQERLFSALRIAVGPSYYSYWNTRDANADHVLENPAQVGLDSATVYSRKNYLGGRMVINVNNLNNELFPTRGINWVTSFGAYGGLNADSRPYTAFQTDMSIYASLSDPAKLIAVLRGGGGHIFSKDFEFFQAMSVGANNYLRGFRKNRFSGRSMAYGSAELRVKIGDIRSYFLPGAFGVLGFDDVARVWADGEQSKRWHNAYGAGLYFIPYNLFILSGAVAFSKEETLFNITLGTKLNLTF